MRRFADYVGTKVYKVKNQDSYQELETIRLAIDHFAEGGPLGNLYKVDKSGKKVLVGKANFKMEHTYFAAGVEKQ